MTITEPRRPRRTRIEDVAAAAEVSVATVSRALRGLPNVAESTRQRVHDVAAALNYRPDPAASRLAAGHTRTIIVLVPHLASWYFSTVVAGAEAICADAGFDFMVIGVNTLDECHRLFDERHQLERRADGVIAVNIPVTDTEARSLRERGVMLSTVGTRVAGCPSVYVDDVAVGRLAATTLLELGHRRIAMIGGGGDPLHFDVPKLRHRGFADRLAEAGIELPASLVDSGNFGITGGQEAAHRLLSLADPPTALFALSDEMAFGALLAFTERNIEAGRDVSVIGVDDHDVSKVLGLTTIRQRVPEQGALAARNLLSAIAGESVDHHPTISPVELVVRATTGPRELDR
jgi:LacI family repressor for deo operon, udp, cdd, tsx, nupC, and nupG